MTERVQKARRSPLPVARRWRALAITGAVAATGILALVALHRPAGQESRYAVVDEALAPAATPMDPLMAELIRCRALPPEVDDPACRAAWEENRRRFFGESRATRVPGDPLPASAPIPTPGSAPAATER